MPRRVLKKFRVEWFQLLGEDGKIDSSLLSPTEQITEKEIKGFYASMVLIRAFDQKALKLQRAGRLGTYASLQGQEAIQVACAAALHPKDWLFPAFRENGLSILRGIPMSTLYQYWSGDERGSDFSQDQHQFPIAIPVGTHIPHAVGAAWAAKFKGDPIAVVASFGDGATSKGDFHEGLNFAGVFRLPVVFVCQNNQWAISVPLSRQTAAASLAQKAISYGFEGIQVDGNDVFGVYMTMKRVLEKARRGEGPTLIECLTYRLQDHTTADDASRYRSEEELALWKKKDPLTRLRIYLKQTCHWSDSDDSRLRQEADKRVSKAVQDYESVEPLEPTAMFDHIFATLPQELVRQKKILIKRLQKEGMA